MAVYRDTALHTREAAPPEVMDSAPPPTDWDTPAAPVATAGDWGSAPVAPIQPTAEWGAAVPAAPVGDWGAQDTNWH